MLQEVVNLVVVNGLQVYRSGYYVTRTLRKVFAADGDMLGSCWGNILLALQPVLERQAIIPVMDTTQKAQIIRALSGTVKIMDIIREAGHADSLSITNAENIWGEVFYADSHYSILTQVVDLISYLRLASDFHREGKRLTAFKQRLRALSEALGPAMARDGIIAMRYNGQIQLPTRQ